MKKWRDFNEVGYIEEKLDKFDKLMKEKPNFNKAKGSRKVYAYKNFSIYEVKNGFVLHNTKKEFSKGHTHIKTFEMAKTLAICVHSSKLPKTRNPYLLESCIRTSTDEAYKGKLRDLIEVGKNKR